MPAGGVARAVKLGVGPAGPGEEWGGEQGDRLSFRKAGGGRSSCPARRLGGLTLAASDSCTSSSTDSARQDRLSREPSRRKPPHRVAIAARRGGSHSPEPPRPAAGWGSGSGSGSGSSGRTSVWALASPAAPGQLQKASAPETLPGAQGPEAARCRVCWAYTPAGKTKGRLGRGSLGRAAL